MTPSEATKKAIKLDGKSIQEVAYLIGYSDPNGFYNALNEPARVDCISRSVMFMDSLTGAGHDFFMQYICMLNNGMFVKNPDVTAIQSVDMSVIGIAHKEFGESINSIVNALSDGIITKEESEEIRKEWEDLKQVMEPFVLKCEMVAE